MTTKEVTELASLVAKLNEAILEAANKQPHVWADLGSNEWAVREAGLNLSKWIRENS